MFSLKQSLESDRKSWWGIVVLSVFLIFFEPILAFNLREIVDDVCYLSWLQDFLSVPQHSCPVRYHYPGVALFWLPAGMLGTVASWWTPLERDLFTVPGIAILSFAVWAWALYELEKGLRSVFGALSLPSAVLFLLSIPVLHYATARTTMSHIAELFLAFGSVKFLMQRRWILALFLAVWLSATRLNDAPLLGAIVLAWLASYFENRTVDWKKLSIVFVIASLCFIPFAYIALFSDYGGDTFYEFIAGVTYKEIRRTFIGDSWGLLYTASGWCLALAIGTLYLRKLGWAGRGLLGWMWLELIVVVGSEGMGNAFGYRYLIGTYAAAFAILWELWPTLSKHLQTAVKVSVTISALWLTHLLWVFDHYSSAWDVLRRALHHEISWSLALRQFLHPILRFGESPLGVLLRSNAASTEGPFRTTLNEATLWLNAVLTIAAVTSLLVLVWTVFRRRDQRTASNHSLNDTQQPLSVS